MLRVKRLQGLEVFEGVRVECNEPEKSWNFFMTNRDRALEGSLSTAQPSAHCFIPVAAYVEFGERLDVSHVRRHGLELEAGLKLNSTG